MSFTAYALPHPPIVIEEIGKGHLDQVKNTRDALDKVRGEVVKHPPETIVLMSPHSPILLRGVTVFGGTDAKGDFGVFGHPEIGAEITLNSTMSDAIYHELRDSLTMPVDFSTIPHALDHGALVPLMLGMGFSDKAIDHPKLVWISVSPTDHKSHYEIGRAIRRVVGDNEVVFVASGDLSHRLTPDAPAGYDPAGEVFDAAVCDLFRTGELSELMALDPEMIEAAGECGLRSLVTLAGCFSGSEKEPIKSEVISYEGPFGVGYLVARVSD